MRTNNQLILIKIILFVLLLLICCTILAFSLQSRNDSDKTSLLLCGPLIRYIIGTSSSPVSEDAKKGIETAVQFFVRKAAHFVEYASLGAYISFLLTCYRKRCRVLKAFLLSLLLAALDELFQHFRGRAGMWQDVLWDALGALFGAVLAWLIVQTICYYRYLKKNRPV